MRVFPPYGRTIARMLARGQKPAAIGVLLAKRWDCFEHAARVCIKPDDWAVGRWEFGFLRNQHVVAIYGDDVEPAQFGWLLIELMRAGPRLLWMCDQGGRWIYKGDFPDSVHGYAVLDIRERNPDSSYVPWSGPSRNETLDARTAYEAAQRRAALIEAALPDTDGAAVRRYLYQSSVQEYVERLFSSPYAVPDESIAA